MVNTLTERQKRIMELALKRYEGNLNLAAKEDRLVGMAMKHCLSPLFAKGYCRMQDGQYFLTESGYAALSIPMPMKTNQTDKKHIQKHGGTKVQQVVQMLKKPEGATIEEIMAVTGWKSHTVRALISRNIKKMMKFTVHTSSVPGEARHYHVEADHDAA